MAILPRSWGMPSWLLFHWSVCNSTFSFIQVVRRANLDLEVKQCDARNAASRFVKDVDEVLSSWIVQFLRSADIFAQEGLFESRWLSQSKMVPLALNPQMLQVRALASSSCPACVRWRPVAKSRNSAEGAYLEMLTSTNSSPKMTNWWIVQIWSNLD